MTFDGSPQDTRHGVGGFPKLPEHSAQRPPSPHRRSDIIAVVVIGVLIIAAFMAVALFFVIVPS